MKHVAQIAKAGPRRFRFSLRFSFLCVTLVCVAAGLIVGPEWRRRTIRAKRSAYQKRWSLAFLVHVNPNATSDAEVTELFVWGGGLASLPSPVDRFENLRALSIGDSGLTAVPPQIETLSKLEGLTLDRNQITELPPWLGQLPRLRRLSLSGNPISNTSVEQLTPLRQLIVLNVADTNVTAEGVTRLRRALPHCFVVVD